MTPRAEQYSVTRKKTDMCSYFFPGTARSCTGSYPRYIQHNNTVHDGQRESMLTQEDYRAEHKERGMKEEPRQQTAFANRASRRQYSYRNARTKQTRSKDKRSIRTQMGPGQSEVTES